MPRGNRVGSQEAVLAGRRIVVTRPDPDGRRLAKRLRAAGATPIPMPAIRIEFTDPPELDAALAELASFDWIVFTSKHGVEAVFRRTKRLAGPKVAAIGPATARALAAHDVATDLVPPTYVAEAVLEAMGDVAGRRILLPRAEVARAALPDGLRARGATVVEIAAYRTRPVGGERPDLTGVDAVTFTSSSTVRGFLEGGPLPRGARVVCIGPVTAATARELGLEVSAVADEYTEDGLIAALTAAFSR